MRIIDVPQGLSDGGYPLFYCHALWDDLDPRALDGRCVALRRESGETLTPA
jgi:hypothetical protein